MNLSTYMQRHVTYKSNDFLRITIDTNIDELALYPDVKELHITGLTQKYFDIFVQKYAGNYEFIYFFKCPNIHDLSGLASLTGLKYVAFYWNKATPTLWTMGNSLKGVCIIDFVKLNDISLLETAPALEELHLSGGGMAKPWNAGDISSIVHLTQLKKLSIPNVKFDEIIRLRELTNLSSLTLSNNIYSIEEYAYLAATMPNTNCECFKGYIDESEYKYTDGKNIKIVGKRQPRLNSEADKIRIDKSIERFNELVEKYKQDAGIY